MAVLVFAHCTVDLERGEVHRPGGRERLAPKERALLLHLAERAGAWCSRASLLDAVWGYQPGTRTHTLATTVYTLRQKIEPDPSHPSHLIARRGRGYCLQPAASTGASGSRASAAGTAWMPRPELEAAVADALSEHRHVALVGPAGVGKSRLAAEVVRACAPRFPGGVLRADLACVVGRAGLVRALAGAVGQADGLTVERLRELVGERGHTLWWVDDTDTLDADAVEELAALMVAGITWLSTGRRALPPLRAHPVVVPPLGPPDAVRLLLERAQGVVQLPSEVQGTVLDRIVQATGGLPLALELAAADLAVLTLEELADRLEAMPLGGLQATLARTWEALAPEAQHVLGAIAWFAGSVDLADLTAAVAPADPVPGLRVLAEHSVIVCRREGARTVYSVLPPWRRFCRSRLGAEPQVAGRLADAHERVLLALRAAPRQAHHLVHDLALGRGRARDRGDTETEAELAAIEVRVRLDGGEVGHDTLALAEQAAERAGEGSRRAAELWSLAAECAGQLHDFARVERLLARVPTAADPARSLAVSALRARMWAVAPDTLEAELDALPHGTLDPTEGVVMRAVLARRRHDRQRQLAVLEGLDAARLEGPAHRPGLRVRLHMLWGDAVFAVTGCGGDALVHLEAAALWSRRLAGSAELAGVLHVRGIVHARLGDLEAAVADHEASVQIMRGLGKRARRLYYELHLANTWLIHRTRLDEAEARVVEALRFFGDATGHPLDRVVALNIAAELALVQGRLEDARSGAREARAGLSVHEANPLVGDALMCEGQAAVRLGDPEGWRLVDAAVEAYRRSGLLPAWVLGWATRAALRAAAGDAREAARDRDALQVELARHPRFDLHATLP